MPKMYKRGFFGGKFLPFHNGHRYCIRIGAAECGELVVILFAGSGEETVIRSHVTALDAEYLTEEARIKALEDECAGYPNVRFTVLDCREMHRKAVEEGTDTWDAETPYVMAAVGDFQAVYSSEPGYDAYFRRAYPFAEHRMIDPPRIHVPISGTMLRNMSAREAKKWI